MDCLFCKIIAREIPAHIVYEDNQLTAFKDIDPKAPVHILIIPRRHINTLNDCLENDLILLGQMANRAKILAAEFNINDSGYRFVINCHEDAGQSVFHLHAHLLGGRIMSWPPG